MLKHELRDLSDPELTASFGDLMVEEQFRTVSILDHIGELDRRRLFYHYPSLRSYLVTEHGLEDWVADRRIRLARTLLRHPELREKMLGGGLNATLLGIAIACAHREKLSDEDFVGLAQAIAGMSTRKARREVAARYPKTMELPPDRIRPLNETQSELRCVISNELADRLEEELPGMLAHSHPGASLGEILDVTSLDFRNRHHPEEKAKRAEKRRQARCAPKAQHCGNAQRAPGDLSEMLKTPTPADESASKRPEPRFFSEAQGTDLILRDGYGCAYIDPVTGQRCGSGFGLEKDHVVAWHDGGKTEIANGKMLCRAHHARVSFLRFGEKAKFAWRPRG